MGERAAEGNDRSGELGLDHHGKTARLLRFPIQRGHADNVRAKLLENLTRLRIPGRADDEVEQSNLDILAERLPQRRR
jgi:hypothetical protein